MVETSCICNSSVRPWSRILTLLTQALARGNLMGKNASALADRPRGDHLKTHRVSLKPEGPTHRPCCLLSGETQACHKRLGTQQVDTWGR